LAAHEELKRTLRDHGLPGLGSLIDQIQRLPKREIFRLGYEALKAEAPSSSAVFREELKGAEPTTAAGQQLMHCVHDLEAELDDLPPYAFAKKFVLEYMGRLDRNIESIRYGLFVNSQNDWSTRARNGLGLVRLLWLTDPESPNAPSNIKGRGFYEAMDPLSVWAWWSRQLTNPFSSMTEAGPPGALLGGMSTICAA
jgi:hypothetical protein